MAGGEEEGSTTPVVIIKVEHNDDVGKRARTCQSTACSSAPKAPPGPRGFLPPRASQLSAPWGLAAFCPPGPRSFLEEIKVTVKWKLGQHLLPQYDGYVSEIFRGDF